MLDRSQPVVMAGIDTEADDQWSAAGRRQLSVRNAERLPELQALFESYGVRPTYLVTYEMATREPAMSILRDLGRSGRCEIGAHLHPWSSPPFRPEDLEGHTYPHNLPIEVLDRQLTELTAVIQSNLGVQPKSYRAGRNGFDGRTIPIIERLRYTVDTSVDPLFNERRKGGMIFAGAPAHPYHPDPNDVCRAGGSRVLEIPISAGTLPALPRWLESLYTRMRPIPGRGYLRRLGLKPVWLRPSYSTVPDMLRFAARLARQPAACMNFAFHSSELLPGGSPYTPDETSVACFQDALSAVLADVTGRWGARGVTYAEYAQERASAPTREHTA